MGAPKQHRVSASLSGFGISTLEPKAGSGLRLRASLAILCARLSTGVLETYMYQTCRS
jgi:hypothetical protein